MESVLLDVACHRRSPATMPGYHRGRPPRNKGEEYPADPPTVEEIIAVMRIVGDGSDGYRLRALTVLLGPPACGSANPSRFRRATSTAPAVPCSSGAGRAANAERSEWTAGHGTSSTPGWRSAAGCRSARVGSASAGPTRRHTPSWRQARLLRSAGRHLRSCSRGCSLLTAANGGSSTASACSPILRSAGSGR